MRSTPPFPPIEESADAGALIRPAAATPQEHVEESTATRVHEAFERAWSVVVWNDPVNTMSYVTFVFQKVLKMEQSTAERHMMEVHQKGKSIVAQETREHAEFLVHRIQSFGLNATLERA